MNKAHLGGALLIIDGLYNQYEIGTIDASTPSLENYAQILVGATPFIEKFKKFHKIAGIIGMALSAYNLYSDYQDGYFSSATSSYSDIALDALGLIGGYLVFKD